MGEIRQIYNKFFIRLFSDPVNVKDFLNDTLPQIFREKLDLSDLSFDMNNYVSKEFKDRYTDMVVKVHFKDQSKSMDLYYLFEHKSYKDLGGPFRKT